jgi:peptidoglycan/LPS O-acetylase OafA/YrhL
MTKEQFLVRIDTLLARGRQSDRPPLSHAEPGPSKRFYVAELDGLRFFAFLAVFLAHAVPEMPPHPTGLVRWHSFEWWWIGAINAGGFGVDLFFVLSSYLITALLVRETDVRGGIDVPAFWVRRALRIWPLYFAFLFGYLMLVGLPARYMGAFALFVANWAFMAWSAPSAILVPLWSLSVEEQFYLVWPLVLAAVPRRFLRPVCVVLAVIAVIARYALIENGVGITNVWINTVAHGDAIAIGAWLALGRQMTLRPVARRLLGFASVFVGVLSTGVLLNELLQPAGTGLLLYFRVGPAYAVLGTLAFLAVALACGSLLVAALSAPGLAHPTLVYLGRISYGLYVFHAACIAVVHPWWWPWRCLLGFGLTLAAAAASYRWLERPFLRLKQRYTHVHSDASSARTED